MDHDRDGKLLGVRVVRADPRIAVARELLEHAGDGAKFRNGLLVLGTAGTHTYRPVAFTDTGEVVCDLVDAYPVQPPADAVNALVNE